MPTEDKDKSSRKPRDVALAVVYCRATRRVLLVTSRKHKGLWICTLVEA